jgi:hypothetical protein
MTRMMRISIIVALIGSTTGVAAHAKPGVPPNRAPELLLRGTPGVDMPKVDLKLVKDTLRDPKDPYYEAVRSVCGRVLPAFNATGACGLLTVNPKLGTMLALSANHVLHQNLAGIADLTKVTPEQRRQLSFPFLIGGERERNLNSVSDKLRNSQVMYCPPHGAKQLSYSEFTNLSPAQDFGLLCITSEVLSSWDNPKPICTEKRRRPAKVFDPRGLLGSSAKLGDPRPGDPVIVVGYPGDRGTFSFGGEQAFSVGRICTTKEAAKLVRETRRGPTDREAFNPKVEFISDARVLPGYSGGACFDKYGQFLGVSIQRVGEHSRFVKASYIVEQLKQEFTKLSLEERAHVAPLLSGLFAN